MTADDTLLKYGQMTGKKTLKDALNSMVEAKLRGDIEKLENMPKEVKTVMKTVAEWDKIVNAHKKRQRKATRGW